jgi:16S rRNA (guanine1207-N2)-methyltransferase
VSYPGVFAAGRVDEGTALLIGALPSLESGARVLDYGCGSGVIAAAMLAEPSCAALALVDSDSVALEAARENVPGARRVLGIALRDAGGRYAAILSNPPLHRGMVEDHGTLEALIIEAPAHLEAGGVLQIVVQRRLPLDRLLAKHFASVAIAAETSRYRVWRAATAP